MKTKNQSDIQCQPAETPEEREACLSIRRVVFVEEQKVPAELEIDGLDPAAQHFMGHVEGVIVATCRVRIVGTTAKIERVAVLKEYRGQGIGERLMKYILQELPRKGDVHLFKLGAQVAVIPFYEKLGFTACSGEYMDAGIPHVDMQQVLNRPDV